MILKFKKLVPEAIIPTRGSLGAAGLDLYSIEDKILHPGEWKIFRTGLIGEIPDGYVGLVCPRSGLAAREGVTVLNAPGIADSDYRGEILVILINQGPMYQIHKGDRIAQLVIQKIETFDPVEVTELTETNRGANGLGSTGT